MVCGKDSRVHAVYRGVNVVLAWKLKLSESENGRTCTRVQRPLLRLGNVPLSSYPHTAFRKYYHNCVRIVSELNNSTYHLTKFSLARRGLELGAKSRSPFGKPIFHYPITTK